MKEDIQGLQTEMKEVKEDIQDMKEDIQDMKGDIQGLQTEMKEVKEDIQETKEDVQELRGEVEELKESVRSIETTLENEIVHGIKIIAEAHFDLHRKLHEALKITNEEELIALRVTNLEKEMRQVKERLDKTA